MYHPSQVLRAGARAALSPIRETPFQTQTLSVGRFYLPPAQGLGFPAAEAVQRVHLFFQGGATLRSEATRMEVGAGQVGRIPAHQAHQIVAGVEGVSFVTLAFRAPQPGEPSPSAAVELGSLSDGSLGERLSEWSRHLALAGRLALIHPEGEASTRVFDAQLVYVCVEGEAELIGPDFQFRLGPADLAVLPAHTDHQLSGAGATLLALTETGRADDPVHHLVCGARASRCSLASLMGDGVVLLNARGEVLDYTDQAAHLLPWLGGGLALGSNLPPRAQAWLDELLRHPPPGQPMKTLWELEPRPLSALLIPMRGGAATQTFLLNLRAVSPPADRPHPAAPARSSSPPPWEPCLPPWEEALSAFVRSPHWVLAWGERGSGHEPFARELLRRSRSGEAAVVWLAPEGEDAQGLLARVREQLTALTPQRGGSVVLTGLDGWRARERAALFDGLTQLSQEPHRGQRLIVLSHDRPGQGLPAAHLEDGWLRRGPFVVYQLPPLRRMARHVPTLLVSCYEALRAERLTLDASAQRLLMDRRWEGNLEELKQLAEALVIASPAGPVDAALLERLLPEERPAQTEAAIPTLAEAERELLERVLEFTGGKKAQAARLLGVTRTRLYRLMGTYRLEDAAGAVSKRGQRRGRFPSGHRP